MYMLLKNSCLPAKTSDTISLSQISSYKMIKGGRFSHNGLGLPEARTDNQTFHSLNQVRWDERLVTSRAPRGTLEGGVRRVGPEAVSKA